jgi:hypothetical protein
VADVPCRRCHQQRPRSRSYAASLTLQFSAWTAELPRFIQSFSSSSWPHAHTPALPFRLLWPELRNLPLPHNPFARAIRGVALFIVQYLMPQKSPDLSQARPCYWNPLLS